MELKSPEQIEQWLIKYINNIDEQIIRDKLYLDENSVFPITEDYFDLNTWSHEIEQICSIPNDYEGHKLVVEQAEGGFEGAGETVFYVCSIRDIATNLAICYFKVDGYYDSWNGTSWEDSEIKLVKPVQVTITQYQEIE